MGLLRDYINCFIGSNNQNARGRAGDFGGSVLQLTFTGIELSFGCLI